MLKTLLSLAVAVALFVPVVSVFAADEEDGPKHSIKEVMKEANKGGLLKKVTSGEATQDEKLQLLDYYVSLVESKPEKGDMNSWNELAGKSALAAAKVAVGREGATEELKAATNCAACHKIHK